MIVDMLRDTKFKWLIAAGVLVAILEFLSLAGIKLPPKIAIPFFLLIIIGIGHHTLYEGVVALFQLNFKSIHLLMLIAVCGAYYLEKYEEAAVVIVLYTLAEYLEDVGIAKSKSAIGELVAQMPKQVLLKGQLNPVPVYRVAVNDIAIIKPMEMIPFDGEVVEGISYVDESSITGEPFPKDKFIGDKVFAGTWNKNGYLEIKVEKTSENSTFAKIQEIVFQATKRKAKTQKFIETFSQYYTPSIIAMAILWSTMPTLLWGFPFEQAFLESLALLVISCPCALVISTPISIYSALGNASSKGILVKGGVYLEAIGQIRAIAFDKTRTLTYGRPIVTDIIPFGNATRELLLSCAAGIEGLSEHPLAQSIMDAAAKENMTPHEVENFQSHVGKGVKADCLICEDRHHCIGKLQFILEEHEVPEEVLNLVEELQKQGKTVILISTHEEVEGVIALTDEIRPESKEVINALKRQGIVSIMLTGDHQMPAEIVAKEIGIKEIHAEQLPEDKAESIEKLLRKYKKVGMVGDGVNDAPALALASVGITMSSLGSDTAIETASIVILNDRLHLIPYLVSLGRRTMRIIQVNTIGAVAVKFFFIGLALAGWPNLALAIFADVGMTLLVILNSLRLMR
jgi:Cd2+/Zn2+-exporting ATPase